MDKSNDWNSSFWINELAKLAEDSKYALTPDLKSNVSSESDMTKDSNDTHTFGKLVEVDDSNRLETKYDTEKSAGTESGIHDNNDKNDFNFTFPVKQVTEEQTVGNAGNYQSNTKESRSTTTNIIIAKMKKTHDTEIIHCTLKDLMLGEASPVIQAAIKKMEEDSKGFLKECNKSNHISFESFLERQKEKKEGESKLSAKAKQFVPFSFNK